MAGQLLAEQGRQVVLHARSQARAADARAALPETEAVLVGDLSTLAAMRDVAAQANALGRLDAVIHNLGIGYREPARVGTADGPSQLWAVNVLAPYVLTVLMEPPGRLVYLSSGTHERGDPSLRDLQWSARRWPDVPANAVSPGWVPTCMGGPGAPGDMDLAPRTQAWLAASEAPEARRSGRLLQFQRDARVHPAARDPTLQDHLDAACREASGIALP